MQMLEEAIDDYFHSMVRTHPWDKKRFEAALAQLQDWLDAEFGKPAPLAALTARNIDRFQLTLSGTERAVAEEAIADLCTWLTNWGWLETNPLAHTVA